MEDINININKNECQELKNIKYKNMLLNGQQTLEQKLSNDLTNLDKFLESEKNNNINEPWCKLNKTIKKQKLQEFADYFKIENNLTEEEKDLLLYFLKDCLKKKKLQRVKDVIYDKDIGIIKQIPALCYSNNFISLKNIDKRISTLKSLAPKKSTQGTIRKKKLIKDSDSEEDDEK